MRAPGCGVSANIYNYVTQILKDPQKFIQTLTRVYFDAAFYCAANGTAMVIKLAHREHAAFREQIKFQELRWGNPCMTHARLLRFRCHILTTSHNSNVKQQSYLFSNVPKNDSVWQQKALEPKFQAACGAYISRNTYTSSFIYCQHSPKATPSSFSIPGPTSFPHLCTTVSPMHVKYLTFVAHLVSSEPSGCWASQPLLSTPLRTHSVLLISDSSLQ